MLPAVTLIRSIATPTSLAMPLGIIVLAAALLTHDACFVPEKNQ